MSGPPKLAQSTFYLELQGFNTENGLLHIHFPYLADEEADLFPDSDGQTTDFPILDGIKIDIPR